MAAIPSKPAFTLRCSLLPARAGSADVISDARETAGVVRVIARGAKELQVTRIAAGELTVDRPCLMPDTPIDLAHAVPSHLTAKDAIDWLDRYLGVVQ